MHFLFFTNLHIFFDPNSILHVIILLSSVGPLFIMNKGSIFKRLRLESFKIFFSCFYVSVLLFNLLLDALLKNKVVLCIIMYVVLLLTF